MFCTSYCLWWFQLWSSLFFPCFPNNMKLGVSKKGQTVLQLGHVMLGRVFTEMTWPNGWHDDMLHNFHAVFDTNLLTFPGFWALCPLHSCMDFRWLANPPTEWKPLRDFRSKASSEMQIARKTLPTNRLVRPCFFPLHHVLHYYSYFLKVFLFAIKLRTFSMLSHRAPMFRRTDRCSVEIWRPALGHWRHVLFWGAGKKRCRSLWWFR